MKIGDLRLTISSHAFGLPAFNHQSEIANHQFPGVTV